MSGMNWGSYVFSGFVATVCLTTALAVCRGQGFTRMDISLLLGTAFSHNRERAKMFGFLIHFLLGWVFSFLYVIAFMKTGWSPLWLGPTLGALHAAFVLSAGMWILPAFHPRMASEDHGPDPTHQLEPPGYLALNYGKATPVAIAITHILYGSLIGLLYR